MQRYFLSCISVLLLLATSCITAEAATNKRYNVLSIGSKQYYGLLTARFIDYMEKKAYFIAKSNDCLVNDEREHQKIAMTELFDYVTGSDTGAIIAGTLLIKNNDPESMAKGQKNKYWANTTVEWFD